MGNRKRRTARGMTCPSISYPGGTYLALGVPTLARGYPPWPGGGGTYFGWREGVPILARGYLPWLGVPTLARGTHLGWDGTYLRQGGTYLGQGGIYLGQGVSTLARGSGTYLGWGMGYLPWLGVPTLGRGYLP